MSRGMLVIMCVCAAIMSVGCKASEEPMSIEKIQKKLMSIETYTAMTSVTQISNKGEKSYEISQEAKRTGEYRLVVTAPEKIAGTVTVFNGTSTFQYNPRVDGSIKIDLPVSQIRNEILLTSFIKNYTESLDTKAETSTTDGAATTVLEAIIPGTNPYMKTEKLWVDNETGLPVKLVIYDENNSERIVVAYKKIEYNTKLGDEIFALPEQQKTNEESAPSVEGTD